MQVQIDFLCFSAYEVLFDAVVNFEVFRATKEACINKKVITKLCNDIDAMRLAFFVLDGLKKLVIYSMRGKVAHYALQVTVVWSYT